MVSIKERINAHLPIVLQLLSTVSLVIIALSAICGSQSLKKLSAAHEIETHKSHMHNQIPSDMK
tara:strand:+ start:445 stop:636 length:192 start_codon:yes stop_codon:yes gene_type:complete